ncbi:MAG: hypothetical protein OXC81_01080, partial [Betaproteobacteria bacterium]|nr:hypothetical protein [Betaproteobacteria bacterium]
GHQDCPLAAVQSGSLKEIGLNHQVAADEVGRITGVGNDATHRGRAHYLSIRLVDGKIVVNRPLLGQIKTLAGGGENIPVTGI